MRHKKAGRINIASLKKYEQVRISWVDTSCRGHWSSPHEPNPLTPVDVVTLGFVVGKNPKHVTVAQSIGDRAKPRDETWDNQMCIPRGCIESIERIKHGE